MDKKCFLMRPATAQDINVLASLEQACYSHPWSLGQLQAELGNPVSSVTVCVDGERIVGYLCYWLVVGEMQVLKVTTCQQMRRQGVAASLMRAAFEQQDELCSVWLEVRESNSAAIALYLSLGFRAEGRRKHYYPDGEDALMMVKE